MKTQTHVVDIAPVAFQTAVTYLIYAHRAAANAVDLIGRHPHHVLAACAGDDQNGDAQLIAYHTPSGCVVSFHLNAIDDSDRAILTIRSPDALTQEQLVEEIASGYMMAAAIDAHCRMWFTPQALISLFQVILEVAPRVAYNPAWRNEADSYAVVSEAPLDHPVAFTIDPLNRRLLLIKHSDRCIVIGERRAGGDGGYHACFGPSILTDFTNVSTEFTQAQVTAANVAGIVQLLIQKLSEITLQ